MAKSLSVIFGGGADKESATAVAFSLINTNVTLLVNGVTYTITMSAFGDDRFANDDNGETIAGYIGSVAVSDLPNNSLVEWSAEQGAGTDQGDFYTSGFASEDCALFLATCFNSRTKTSKTVAWDLVETYIKDDSKPPVAGIILIDDIFYADGQFGGLLAGEEATSAQGKVLVATTDFIGGLRPKYNYACFYLTWAGVLDGWVTDSSTVVLDAALVGSSFDYCRSHTRVLVGQGDHEYGNDYWDIDYTVVPNQIHATAGNFDGNARVVYDQAMFPLQGGELTRTNYADGFHWSQTFNGVNVIVYDPITNAVGFPKTQWLGTDQIIDGLNTVNPEHVFTVVCHAASPYRELTTTPEPVYKYNGTSIVAETELEWIETGNTPKSFMDNPATNGTTGNCVLVRGDWHYGYVLHWIGAASTGKAEENFYELALNTVSASNGATVTTMTDDMIASMATDGCEPAGGLLKPDFTAHFREEYKHITLLEYFGSRLTKETILTQYIPTVLANGTLDIDGIWNGYDASKNVMDGNGVQWGVIFDRKFVQYNDNAGFAVDAEPDYQLPEAAGGESDSGLGI